MPLSTLEKGARVAFNSYLFVLFFLPVALALYYAVALSRLWRFRLPTLILLTLVFFAWGAAKDLPILLGSIVINYALAVTISRLPGWPKRATLAAAVSFNVLALIYYKYTGFLIHNIDGLTGAHLTAPHILLPLAISFYTFQQIAFLVDTANGTAPAIKPLRYAASILFFPSLISGPIVFFRELAPQFANRPDGGRVMSNIIVGLVIFSIGLFKKTVIADSFGLWVDPIFAAVATGHRIGFGAGWGLACAYLLQIYYDFSGYSDMAIGVARMLSILLPLNFFSPIRCTSIVDFWRRWHITLGRFCNLYIFQPISIPLTRWSADRELGRWPSLVVSTLLPTFLVMVIIGSWHGGSWTYVVFGGLHGVYMVLNEIWNTLNRKARKGKRKVSRWILARGNLVTMTAVAFSMIAFRSQDMITAARFWAGMFGVEGLSVGWTDWPVFRPLGFAGLLGLLIPGFLLAYLAPNAYQLTSAFEPALEWKRWRDLSIPVIRLTWRPTYRWTLVVTAILFFGLVFIARGGASFVYFNF
jgi:D-alanyl-lipoteichoic acid acyltransferase DltB (MBOAT superfamily)